MKALILASGETSDARSLLTWTRVWSLPEGFNRDHLLSGRVELEIGLRASGRLEVEGEPQLKMKLAAGVAAARVAARGLLFLVRGDVRGRVEIH